jgi:hypothetical protein
MEGTSYTEATLEERFSKQLEKVIPSLPPRSEIIKDLSYKDLAFFSKHNNCIRNGGECGQPDHTISGLKNHSTVERKLIGYVDETDVCEEYYCDCPYTIELLSDTCDGRWNLLHKRTYKETRQRILSYGEDSGSNKFFSGWW